MILECSHCGAPLDVGGRSPFTRCNYCGRTSRTSACKTQHRVTPQGWAPPQQWLPPPQFTVHVIQPLPYKKASGAIGCIIFVSVMLPLIIAGAAGFAIWAAAPRASVPDAPAGDDDEAEAEPAWDGTSTLRCSAGDRLQVSGVTMKAALPEVIVAESNCVLEITDSELRGDVIITMSGTARVTIRRGEIVAGRTVAKASSSSKLEVDGAKITLGAKNADGVVGIEVTSSVDVTVSGASVTVAARDPSKAVLVDATSRGRVRLVDGTYAGEFTIKADGSSEVRREGPPVEARLEVRSAAKVSGFKERHKAKPQKGAPARPGAPGDPLAPAFGPQPSKGPGCGCAPSDLACNMKCSAGKK